MGKKRNNAAKKKQVAKKKRLSSAYGVSVLKGGTIASKNGVLNADPINAGNSHDKRQKITAKTSASHKKNDSGGMFSSTQDAPGKRTRDRQDENDEFERMHASLEERSLALQARKGDQRRSKKERQKRQKGWGKFARPSSNFAPATLTLAPKSTRELVDDAADQVARGMNEIGQRETHLSDGTLAKPGQSSLAAAASLNWKMRVSNVADPVQQSKNQTNSFAALGGDSDSDNEWADKKARVVQQFQFKPASFSFQPAISNPLAMGPAVDDDFDPDL